ncbi:hypothetical protein [Solicola sp. PLA-1-18]|uniref:hypothetical protein n=1 Tax=Solicola sp. PLA-1-18 TaxID=3380532 RepID=UPI003B775A7E
MNPERFLGRDPVVGDLVAVDHVTVVLREAVLLLAEGRGRLDATVVDSVWRGPRGASVVDAVSDLRARLDAVEGAVADLTAAWQEWRHGLARRHDRAAELAEQVSQLAGEDDASGRRSALDRQVDELEEEHGVAAAALARAADELTDTLDAIGDEPDVAGDLKAAFDALDGAVDVWVDASGERTRGAGGAVADVASLAGAVPHLIGVGDGEADPRVRESAAAAPGAHRLLDALDHPAHADAPDLQDASFAPATRPGPSLADRVRGAAAAGDHDEETT